jgi:branched-chain amino acid transport system substrate-binding protein
MQSPKKPWRRGAVLAMLASSALVVTACAPAGSLSADPSEAPAGDEITVKVGLLLPTTGFAAATGAYAQQGWDLYWEENGNKVGNITVETIDEDDASDAGTALNKAKLLVTQEHVDVVVGPILANNSLAVGDYLAREGVANLSQTSADDITQRKGNDFVLRVGAFAGSQSTYPGGQWAYDEGHRTAATLCADYAFGWENCGGFVSAFTAAGGTVDPGNQFWYPATATDMSTYVSQLLNAGTDMVFVATTGGNDGVNFIKAASDFGLSGKTEVLLNCCGADQSVLKGIGDIALGIHSVGYFAEGSDNPNTKEFVKKFEAKYGALPATYSAGTYAAAQALAEALKKAQKKLTGKDLISAIRALSLSDSVMGDVSFDDQNNMVGPVFLRKVEKRADGKLWNVVEETFDDVSQFWTYDQKEYMANPPYSQTFTRQ